MHGTVDIGIRAIAALDDPQRRRIYELVRTSDGSVTRQQCATDLGISRKLAAFHLDKLVRCGLLELGERPEATPRRVGRAPKHYRAAHETVSASVPVRCHEELATVLALAVATREPGESDADARDRVARGRGSALGRRRLHPTVASPQLAVDSALDQADAALETEGFQPYRAGERRIRLANCPFHPVAAVAPALVCGINEQYLSGMLDGLALPCLRAILAPAPGECCVEITPDSATPPTPG